MKTLITTLVVLALAGCGASQQSADTAGTAGTSGTVTPAAQTPSATAGTDAAAAVAPNLIAELTDQTLVYECPKCGMMFDAAGKCTMGCGDLVATQVSYTCPKDNQPVAKAGACARCPMNARVDKTAMAAAVAPDKH